MTVFSDINWVFNKYYSDNPALYRIVMLHSQMVAKKALEISKLKKFDLDPRDIFCAGILHDIGVVKCYAPDINAFGSLPYIQHGLEGSKILEKEGLSQYASICLNHTGAGISKKDIKDNNLSLPYFDFLPITPLEKLICYADKFFSKSRDLQREKSLSDIQQQMKKFGKDSYNRFMELHSLFSAHSQ